MKIVDSKRFLALDYIDGTSPSSSLSYLKEAKELLGHWRAHTRVSPVWPLLSADMDAEGHADTIPQDCFVFFAGPINPASLDVQFGPNFNAAFPKSSAWISIGVLNLIISTISPEENTKLKRFFDSLAIVYEIWTISDGIVSEVDIPRELNGDPIEVDKRSALIGNTPFASVQTKELEFMITSLSAEHRGGAYFPWISDDVVQLLNAYNATVEKFVSEGDPDCEGMLVSALANINSGLSRFTSQCLSGTAPIRITECHFWPHSFLGTGLCNTALRNCIVYVEQTLGEFNVIDRFKALSDIQCDGQTDPNLNDLESCNRDLLARVDPKNTDPLVTPISFFSGRDNFKNDLYTVSAPLETISGVNSKKWSILTITHELSHRFIEPIISHIIPMSEADTICNITQKPKYSKCSKPFNYFELAKRDFIQCVFVYAQSVGFDVEGKKKSESDQLWVLDVMREYHLHIEEIFVHAFDFLYFYESKPDQYIPDIWNSWGVLPHIETKIDEYIVRSAAALLTNKITVSYPVNLIRKELLDYLPKPEQNPATYLNEVRSRISSDDYWNKVLAPRCYAVEWCARFVRLYLYSDEIMPKLRGDQTLGSKHKSYDDYDISSLRLDTKPFRNPLTFLAAFTKGLEPDEAKSVWIFAMLALNLSVE